MSDDAGMGRAFAETVANAAKIGPVTEMIVSDVRRASVGRIVMFRHEVISGLVLPAIVTATPESYAALGDKQMVEAGGWNFPGFVDVADAEDLMRVHLVVFTPANREPSRAIDRGGELAAPCFVQANVPYDPNPVPGTWGWPER